MISIFIFTGCGQKKYDMEYNKDYPVSSYRITGMEEEEVADAFAGDLCVTESNMLEDTDVDMSRAGAAGLFDVTNASVLYAKNVHERMPPASLTKVMTALVALKHGQPDDILTASSNVKITEAGAQLSGIEAGDTMTLDQALHMLLMYSGNDAGVIIAEGIAGSVEAFSEMMNEEAKAIGATNSNFVNPHGLTDDSHYITAYDMYLIFNEAMEYDLFNEIIHMTSYETVYKDQEGNAKEFSCETTNLYLKGAYTPPEQVTVIGGKTGTTNAAGNCLVLLSRDTASKPYISVILRAEEREVLYEEMTDLLDKIDK